MVFMDHTSAIVTVFISKTNCFSDAHIINLRPIIKYDGKVLLLTPSYCAKNEVWQRQCVKINSNPKNKAPLMTVRLVRILQQLF